MTWIDKLKNGVSSLLRRKRPSPPPSGAPRTPVTPPASAPAGLRGHYERGEEFQPGVGSSDYRLFIPIQATLFAIGIVLFIISFAINVTADLFLHKKRI